ncbi:MAG: GNAT family N-acetyltransferase [Arcicella sp.]|nr:GNAT family N-acetyltransferase [Arcicella sp.]
MKIKFKNTNLKLRLFSEEDIPFLKKVYFSSREEELKQVKEWTDDVKNAFLTQQFNAQHDYYQKNYIGAEFFVIEYGNNTIGRLYYDEGFDGGIRIIDIAILPAYQKKGIGTDILEGVFERAKAIEQHITIHVESFNPAMNLYKRLGFQKISETNGVYHLLQWNYKN